MNLVIYRCKTACVGRRLFQIGQILTLQQELYRSGLPWNARDKTQALQSHDHLVDRGWGGLEVALKIGFGWWLPIQLGVVVDEGEILTLFCSIRHLGFNGIW